MANSTQDTDKLAMILGVCFWALIIFIGFWYWNCSDGVRAVKNMHVYEVYSRDYLAGMNISSKYVVSESYLESQGYNVNITLEEAIERTNPKKIEFVSTDVELPEFNGKSVKAVGVNITYDPPLEDKNSSVGIDKISSVNVLIAVQKDWFFHFNPLVITPVSTIYRGNGKCVVISTPNYNPVQVAEFILRCFHD